MQQNQNRGDGVQATTLQLHLGHNHNHIQQNFSCSNHWLPTCQDHMTRNPLVLHLCTGIWTSSGKQTTYLPTPPDPFSLTFYLTPFPQVPPSASTAFFQHPFFFFLLRRVVYLLTSVTFDCLRVASSFKTTNHLSMVILKEWFHLVLRTGLHIKQGEVWTRTIEVYGELEEGHQVMGEELAQGGLQVHITLHCSTRLLTQNGTALSITCNTKLRKKTDTEKKWLSTHW